ncbi:MAG: hypothetical protein HY654_04585 [Acidobacteria bacterium]|nr:hypothetical protein [Acidobacteriota bacterium]
MVEWAIVVSGAGDLDRLDAGLNLETTCSGRLGEAQTRAREATHAAFGAPWFTRLYFGNEFCERLVPSVGQVRRAYDAATAENLRFSLLTPYVTDFGLLRLRALFEWLAALNSQDVEVIVNDWGVLHLLGRDFPALRPVLGRLMNRMLRDPRIAAHFATARAPSAALQALRQSGVTSAVFRMFLTRASVARVEFDNLIQGLDMNFDELGVAASLYIPYGYVATGRVCPIGSLSLRKEEKFDVASPCGQQCQLYTLRFRYSDSPFDNRDQEFIEQGNTYFYVQDPPMIEAAAQMVTRLGISRLVYQPRLPM